MNEKQRRQLDKARLYAQSKGGKCLSTEYKHSDLPLMWDCCVSCHPTWERSYRNTVNGNSWCTECAKTSRADKHRNSKGLEQAKEHAESLGGTCLSTNYINNQTKMLWQCANKHTVWEATFGKVVRSGRWCPECGERKLSERRTRLIFEYLFKHPFPAAMLDWNVNPWTNRLLELDGYCKEFNVAFEHDGKQHFQERGFSKNGTRKDFIYLKFRDEQKKKNCRANGVLLVNVPYIASRKTNDFACFLNNVLDACRKTGLEFSLVDSDRNELKKAFYKA